MAMSLDTHALVAITKIIELLLLFMQETLFIKNLPSKMLAYKIEYSKIYSLLSHYETLDLHLQNIIHLIVLAI